MAGLGCKCAPAVLTASDEQVHVAMIASGPSMMKERALSLMRNIIMASGLDDRYSFHLIADSWGGYNRPVTFRVTCYLYHLLVL